MIALAYADRAPGAAPSRQPGRHHPVHGDARRSPISRGFGQTIWGSDIYKINLGHAEGADLHLRVGVSGRAADRSGRAHRRDRSAPSMVAVLAVFFQVTRVGRALRAVADDHQAAQSVGIPLNQIWLIVWAVSGIVALVAGMMWGAKLGVQFSLSLVALKALPVLILGGFTSDPGRDRRRADHRRRREARRSVSGARAGRASILPAAASRTGSPTCSRSLFLLVRPQGLFGETHHRAGLTTVLYREAGQFKTSYAADQAIFPIAQDRWFVIGLVAFAFLGVPLFAEQYLYTERADPGADPLARRDRAQYPHRLLRPALARHRRLHGGRRLCRLQPRAAPAGDQHHPGRSLFARRDGDAGRHAVRHAVAAHQGLLSRGRDAGLAVFPRMGLRARQMVHQLHALRLGRGRPDRTVRLPDRHAGARTICSCSRSSWCSRSRPRTWCAAASAACGWRCATWISRPRSSASGRCTPSLRPSR